MTLTIRRLTRQDRTSTFDCHDEALNTYLTRYALQNQERHLAGVTYIALAQEAPEAILGYYTLATASVPRTAFAGDTGRSVSPYADAPCLLLARLAVDYRAQGRGLGQALLRDALMRALTIAGEIGCRGLVVDAYLTAVPWYSQFGFVPLVVTPESATQKLFLDLRPVARERSTKQPLKGT